MCRNQLAFQFAIQSSIEEDVCSYLCATSLVDTVNCKYSRHIEGVSEPMVAAIICVRWTRSLIISTVIPHESRKDDVKSNRVSVILKKDA